jgi:hypothetical protein
VAIDQAQVVPERIGGRRRRRGEKRGDDGDGCGKPGEHGAVLTR